MPEPSSPPGVVSASEFDRRLADPGSDRVGPALVELAHEAAAYASTPMSGFDVGVAALGESGAVYFGANLELAGAPLHLAVHAEQTAVANALMHGERSLRALGGNAEPCGHCRQFLQELGTPGLMIATPQGEQPLSDLLPSPFGPSALGVEADALSANADLPGETTGSLTDVAVAAAHRSHAPYTNSPAGVALQLHDGSVVAGAYIESVAYNPSFDALRAALALARFMGWPENPVNAIVLAHAGRARIDHAHSLRETVSWLPTAPDAVEVHAIDSL